MIGRQLGRCAGALALAALVASCGPGAPADDTETVRSAVNSNVIVTVQDTTGAPVVGIDVMAVKSNGNIAKYGVTNASGQVTFSLGANSYRFDAWETNADFYSGAVGHCTTPACTTAQITIPHVELTVVDTTGAALANHLIFWETPAGATGGWQTTGVNGHVRFAMPTGSYRFVDNLNNYDFTSGAAGHCTVPSCTTATITETQPVTVTVTNASGAPVADQYVVWQDGTGATGGWLQTNASGVVVLSVPPGSVMFKIDVDNACFTSTPACAVPGCTSASITMATPVVVTVTDTAGAPVTGGTVTWLTDGGYAGVETNTNASGQATLVPPLQAVRFRATVDGALFYSGPTAHCTVPSCASASVQVSTPTVVTVVDASGNPLSGKTVTPLTEDCPTADPKTTNASGQATFRLPFGHWQFKATCGGGASETFFSGNPAHCYLPGGCATAKIKMPCGQCASLADGASCDDQNPCTGNSTCQSHKCTGCDPVSCTASNSCHEGGACGAETGTCSNPVKPNGATCNDNDACTGTSSCQAGVCAGGSPMTCTASDQCHVVGTCNPATGACSNPTKTDGTSCNDNNSCTQADSCQSGGCTGASPVTCVAQDQCHPAGVCTPGTGACTNPTAPDGTPCGSGDQCVSGTCVSSSIPTGNTPTPIDPTVAMDLRSATAFLYEGPNAQQVGVASGTIRRHQVGVCRGRVLDRAGSGIQNVRVEILGHPEYGHTFTNASGLFSMAVNAGDEFRFLYEVPGYSTVQRTVHPRPLDYAWLPDVVLTAIDPARTIVASNASTPQIAQATPTSDERGQRQSILLFLPGTTATLVHADGTSQSLGTLSVHSTEFTVGPHGPQAMPGELPPSSAYTYAVDISVEEAAGGDIPRVVFNQPVIYYVDNFLHFSVGSIAPVGYYDEKCGCWIASDNGVVMSVLSAVAGLAEVDTNGDGVADSASILSLLGITDDERAALADLYLPGESLWRVPLSHFTKVDVNWPATGGGEGGPGGPTFQSVHGGTPGGSDTKSSSKPEPEDDDCEEDGSIINCQKQTLGEHVPLTGIPFGLSYSSSRVPGYRSSVLDIKLSSGDIRADVLRIDLELAVAGQHLTQSFSPLPNQQTSFVWDGMDGFGRLLELPPLNRTT